MEVEDRLEAWIANLDSDECETGYQCKFEKDFVQSFGPDISRLLRKLDNPPAKSDADCEVSTLEDMVLCGDNDHPKHDDDGRVQT